MSPLTARQLAAGVVFQVLFKGGYAAAELDSALNAAPHLSPRDRALATEIAYGVLRTRAVLTDKLTRMTSRGFSDHQVLGHLLVAAYQMLLLDRVPPFAAVNEAVSAVRELRGAKVGGFANAVLRRLAREPKLERAEAVLASAPGWLVEQMEQAVGRSAARQLLGVEGDASDRSGIEVTPTTIRWRGGTLPEWAELGEQARFAPGALQFRGKGDVRKRPEYAEGRFVVQEEGAQLAALALGATPGHKVLDACAGHGQKASLLADVLGGHGELWLTDLHQKKLEQLQREFFRLGLAPPSCLQVDWSRGPVGDAALRLPRGFDRILVDAPCSGTGTLRRRPEIALRLKPSDAQRLAAVSESILRQAAGYLSPAGRLLFVVCSVLERECEAVVERVGDVLRPLALEAPGLVPIEHGATSLRLLPHEHGTDGFFIACLGRR